MIKVVTNSLGSDNWITVFGHSGSELFAGHRVSAWDLQEILNIVSRDGCELVEVDDTQLNEGMY